MSNLTNGTTENVVEPPNVTPDNASWILANAFLILTMQTGFGMLEAGCVSAKNVANIMMKNVVDVAIGGLTYWSLGYALSFGTHGNSFVRYGRFFTSSDVPIAPWDEELLGNLYVHYFFQFSFATAATTIVSGAVAERMRLEAYMVFSCLNILVYCLPASWAWASGGFLQQMGFFDFAGACVVHMSGGASALIAAIMLGPRIGRFTDPDAFEMSSPVTALTGTFMLWWAWLAFNCGSTFGISDGLWRISALVAVTTINGSIGGSLAGLILSVLMTFDRKTHHYHFDIGYCIQGVLGGLVGITACCAVISPRDAILIGAIGGIIAILLLPVLEWLRIDDPVGAVAVHYGAAIWSTLAVGLFGKDMFGQLGGKSGVFYGGGSSLFLAQLAGTASVSAWSMIATFIIFGAMKLTIGIRMTFEQEIVGADWTEHRTSRAEGMKMQAVLDEIIANGITNEGEMMKAIKVQLQLTSSRKEMMGNESGTRIRNFAGSSSAGLPADRFDLKGLAAAEPPLSATGPYSTLTNDVSGAEGEPTLLHVENFSQDSTAPASETSARNRIHPERPATRQDNFTSST